MYEGRFPQSLPPRNWGKWKFATLGFSTWTQPAQTARGSGAIVSNPKFVFLVSGQPGDETPKRRTENTFANIAWLRVKELVKVYNKSRTKPDALVGITDEVHFIHFCAHTSTDNKYPRVEIYKHPFDKKTDAPSKAHWDEFLDDPSFVEWQPIRDARATNPATALSIVNVYHSIRRAPAGSVLELSIFAHSFVEGPVLTDTNSNTAPPLRDKNDTDGRAATDFNDAMGEDPAIELGAYNGQPPPSGGKGPGGITAIKQFAAAFNAKGTFRIWGCNIQDIVFATPPGETSPRRCLIMSTARQVIEEAYKRPLKKGGMGGSALRATTLPPSDTMLQLDMGHQMAKELELQSDPKQRASFTNFGDVPTLLSAHYNAVPKKGDATSPNIDFFQPATMGSTPQKVIQRSLSDVAKYVTQMMLASYGFVAAAALPDLTVFTGAPGTSSDLSDKIQAHIEPGRLGEANFFALVTGTPMTDEFALVQRHYTKLDATAVRSIQDIAANGLP